MFLEPDEYIVIMNLTDKLKLSVGPARSVNDDELRQLKDIGLKTILNYVYWHVIAQEGWLYVDQLVEQARRVGVKSILAAPFPQPGNLPPEWYGWDQEGRPMRDVISIWNRDATAEIIGILKEAIRRYGGDDVLVIHDGFLMGECVMHNVPCFYDPAAIESYGGRPDAVKGPDPTPAYLIGSEETREWLRKSIVDYFMEIDGHLVDQHRSVWCALQWLISRQSEANGNFALEDILRTQHEAWPDAERVLLQYTYYAHGEPYPSLIKRWKKEFDLNIIVEASYCGGLEKTTPLAIEWGYRGQILAPLHPWGRCDHVGPEQIEQITKAHQLWASSKRTSD